MEMNQPVWITENLAVGPAPYTDQIRGFPQIGISAVVDMRSEYIDDEKLLSSLGIEFLHVPVDDRYAPSFEQIEKLWEFISERWQEGKKVYIHCQNGYGRSPLAAISVLTKSGWPMAKALYLVEDRHPLVSFTDHQQKFLYKLGQKSPPPKSVDPKS